MRALHLSSLSDREAAWRALRLYIEEASAPLGVDAESREFRAFLVGLVNKLAEDVEKGLFGNDPVMRQHFAVSEAVFVWPRFPRNIPQVNCEQFRQIKKLNGQVVDSQSSHDQCGGARGLWHTVAGHRTDRYFWISMS